MHREPQVRLFSPTSQQIWAPTDSHGVPYSAFSQWYHSRVCQRRTPQTIPRIVHRVAVIYVL